MSTQKRNIMSQSNQAGKRDFWAEFKHFLSGRWKKALICFAAAVVAAVCLEWIQVRTQPIDPAKTGESIRKISLINLTIFLFPLFWILSGMHGWKKLTGLIAQAGNGIREDRKRSLICLGLFVLCGGLTYLLLRLYIPWFLGKPFNRMMNILFLAASAAVGCGFCFRRTLGRKPEVFFLILCMLMGFTIAVTEPAKMVSWDEPDHYRQAIDYSYLGQVRLTEEDHQHVDWPSEEGTYDLSRQDAWHARQDELFQEGVVSRPMTKISLQNFWLAFSGIGIFIGRVLGCSYYRIMALGRLFNVLVYAVIGWFAIRRLKYGKMLLGAILLIPECVFLASNYSYDPGVTVFMALGMSYCFAEWQEPSEKITLRNTLIIGVSLFLGCIAKPVYFPILLLPLWMKREKFADRRARRLYWALMLGLMLLLILVAALPFVSSSGAGDDRGGENVNAFEQIRFILSDPLRYADILFRFLCQYFSPASTDGFITTFAYLGASPQWVIYLVLLGVLAFTDKNGTDYGIPGIRISRWVMMAILFGITAMAATSMYIAFTPVGLDTINGCQPRYLLPLFFPGLMLAGSQRMVNNMNRTLYNGLGFAVIGYAGFSSILLLITNLYY